jgi:hypothetical protein
MTAFQNAKLPSCRRAGAGRDDRVRQGGFVRHVLVALAGKPQRVIAEADRRVFAGLSADRQVGRHSIIVS